MLSFNFVLLQLFDFMVSMLLVALYDCRIDKTMDGLKAKLEDVYKASGGRKVNIISHSMGGLLLTCFMHFHNDVSGTSS